MRMLPTGCFIDQDAANPRMAGPYLTQNLDSMPIAESYDSPMRNLHDVEALEREMVRLADASVTLQEMGVAGRRVCEQDFAISKQMIRIEALYQEVLAQAR